MKGILRVLVMFVFIIVMASGIITNENIVKAAEVNGSSTLKVDGNVILGQVAGENAYIETNDYVNFRSTPKIISGNIIGTLRKGEKIKVLEKNDDWYQVSWNNKVGYVAAQFVVMENALKGFDCSTQLSFDKYMQFKGEGYDFVVRYYSGIAGSKKILTREEALSASKAGLKVVVVYQDYNNKIEHFSYDKGVEQCKNAIQKAIEMAQPIGTAIYFPVDIDNFEDTYSNYVDEYFKGIIETMDNFSANDEYKRNWKIGVYGHYKITKDLKEKYSQIYVWQTSSQSKNMKYYGYNMYQNLHDETVLGVKIDVNHSNPDSGNDIGGFTLTDNIPVLGVKINVESLALNLNESGTLIANAGPENATNKNVRWTSDNLEVVSVDDSGKVTGYKEGSAIITATTVDGEYSSSCKVAVFKPTTGIALDLAETTINIGESVRLVAMVNVNDSNNKNVKWSSSNSDVAVVDEFGKVTALKSGSAAITASTEDGRFTAICNISVVQPVKSLVIDKTELKMGINDSVRVNASVIPSDASNKVILWSSSDLSVASVDENGNITALKEGEVIVTAVSEENSSIKQECKVVVIIPVSSIKLNVNKLSLSTSINYNKTKLVAQVLPANATNKYIVFKSSNDKIISVDTNGNVTAKADGVATVTVSTKDGSRSSKCDVTVSTVKSVSLSKSKLYLKKGQSTVLTAKIMPTNAAVKGVVWKSSDSKKVSVDANGKITALAATTKPVIITAVSRDNSKILANCSVYVSLKKK